MFQPFLSNLTSFLTYFLYSGIFSLAKADFSCYCTTMVCTKSPHILFREILEILDELRRDSIKAINAPSRKKMYGLTVRQGSAISQLKLLQEITPEGISLKEFAKHLQMTIPASSLLVESIVCKGYMQRTPNPNDRRAVRIKLTDKGLELFDDVYAQFHDELNRRCEGLTQEELEALSSIVDKLTK